jgi:predicted nucleotidyltransferase
VLLFGGLALGRGDRLSDLDVLVVTPAPRPVRLEAARLRDELREQGFRGERYRLQILVETPEGLRAKRADPLLPGLLRQAVRLRDDPDHPLGRMLLEGG